MACASCGDGGTHGYGAMICSCKRLGPSWLDQRRAPFCWLVSTHFRGSGNMFLLESQACYIWGSPRTHLAAVVFPLKLQFLGNGDILHIPGKGGKSSAMPPPRPRSTSADKHDVVIRVVIGILALTNIRDSSSSWSGVKEPPSWSPKELRQLLSCPHVYSREGGTRA